MTEFGKELKFNYQNKCFQENRFCINENIQKYHLSYSHMNLKKF